jgi:hypothetical protein
MWVMRGLHIAAVSVNGAWMRRPHVLARTHIQAHTHSLDFHSRIYYAAVNSWPIVIISALAYTERKAFDMCALHRVIDYY